MSESPIPLALSWNPFGNSGATPKHALGELLSLAGVAAAALKTPAARGSISLSEAGALSSNAVVSEVTTIDISSNRAYSVQSESPAEAAAAKAAGTVISTAPGADGNVTVVSPNDAEPTSNSGSVSVETKITYADGSTVTSTASLSSDFMTSGNGLARQRLDAIVGGALSESAILARLGITQPDATGTNAATAPTGVDVSATVSSAINVSLTYVAQGDQRSVSGVESGAATACITAFDPAQMAYTPGGVLSTTQESMKFAGSISGGALFNRSSAPWLTGSIGESTDAVTHVPGVNGITIDRQSTQSAQFAAAGAYSSVMSQSQNATQISFSGNFDDGAAGWQNERVTLSASDSSDASEISNADGNSSTKSQTANASLAVSWVPFVPVPGVAINFAGGGQIDPRLSAPTAAA